MSIAKLSIDLEARLAGLQEGMDKAGLLAQRNAEKIEASFNGIKDSAAALGTVLAGAFAGFSLVSIAKTAIDVLNQNSSDTAQKVMEHNTLLGVALQNISDVAQKVIEVATLLGVMAQNDSYTAQKVIEVVTLANALVADDLDNRQSINSLVDVAQAAGIAG